jgi:outer membrane receptor for ferrienterochelin and colicins
VLENFEGEAVSRAFQLDMDLSHGNGWEFKVAYNYLDVYRIVEGSKQVLPFNPAHRLLGVLSYMPVQRPWQADMHINWYGRQALPDTRLSPEAFQRPGTSNPYVLVNAQFTWRFTDLDLYGGCENIFDFRQLRPILSWEDPFSPWFDTSSVWGPTRGREWYVGIRWRKW